ncbi:uncharacterized protein VP01_6992g1 [Puccinia sorghi]|uniref:Uncharacterized protein n=1 Tax=Puccinia sorghi TaxID=27349 RepID=A0A0L6UDV6_9BASI|nr:uncharacterized protein VP01_6992g1 [Puccinia sorghi]
MLALLMNLSTWTMLTISLSFPTKPSLTDRKGVTSNTGCSIAEPNSKLAPPQFELVLSSLFPVSDGQPFSLWEIWIDTKIVKEISKAGPQEDYNLLLDSIKSSASRLLNPNLSRYTCHLLLSDILSRLALFNQTSTHPILTCNTQPMRARHSQIKCKQSFWSSNFCEGLLSKFTQSSHSHPSITTSDNLSLSLILSLDIRMNHSSLAGLPQSTTLAFTPIISPPVLRPSFPFPLSLFELVFLFYLNPCTFLILSPFSSVN